MARTSRSARLRTYWRTVHTLARKTDRPIAEVRALVREARSRGLTHTEVRHVSKRRATSLLKADRQKNFKLTRERDTKMPAPKGPRERTHTEPRRAIDSLDELIDLNEDFDDYDELEIEVTPTYADRGK